MSRLRWFWDTLVFSIREPTRFYATVPQLTSTLGALLYGLVFEVLVAVAEFFYALGHGDEETKQALSGLPVPSQLFEALSWGKWLGLAFAPISYLLEVYSLAALTWVGLWLTKNLKTSFSLLVRVFAFASWVRILSLLGITGEIILSSIAGLIAFGLTSWYWLVAVRETQKITTGKAVIVSLAGSGVALTLGCFVGVPLMMLLALVGLSQLDITKLLNLN